MTGILFVLEIIAFLVVAWWAYTRADAGDDAAETGLLGMKSSTDAPAPPAKKWQASSRRGAPLVPSAKGPDFNRRTGPRWKTVRRRPGRPF